MSQRIVGLVTEYNPFHNGHRYHALKSKEVTGAEFVVAVMSGSFVQRGEPALLDKWTRAATAVQNGVDLVIEIPAAFATSSAEYFATASVHLLNQLGVVDAMCFGSETGTLAPLKAFASHAPHLDAILQGARKEAQTLSYPALRDRLLADHAGLTLSNPNDVLGVEYLKALDYFKSDIESATLKRLGKGYHDQTLHKTDAGNSHTEFSSATGIRHAILSGKGLESVAPFVPAETLNALELAGNHWPEPERLFLMLAYRLLGHTPETLKGIHDMEDGMEYRILNTVRCAENLEALITGIKSKRTTRARIQRILTKILMDVPTPLIGKNRESLPAYLRVLAFNDRGREVLSLARKKAGLPVLTRVTPQNLLDETMGQSLKLDLLSTDLRELLCGFAAKSLDLVTPPFYLK
ncbi:MAG: nucleotidyltransferase [Erysipelotrichaceae bacterium]|nr:nucleotidyltransferase [Erysipelotrichaceae bacterium]